MVSTLAYSPRADNMTADHGGAVYLADGDATSVPFVKIPASLLLAGMANGPK